jgi:hypothetical protein
MEGVSPAIPLMGIDIYTRWKGQSAEETEAQFTGFSTTSGHVGYLREAYHGEPYATKYLLREAFEHPDRCRIPASVLRQRLPQTLALVEERERTVYGETDAKTIAEVKQSFINFVELCEAKERETGAPVLVIASF